MKPTMKLLMLSLLLILTVLISRAHAADGEPDRMALPSMIPAPTIDGKIDDGEWNGAGKIIGFLDKVTGYSLEPRQGFTLVGYDQANLYVAMSTELPPDGQLVAKVKRDDDVVHHDDSIELWLDPNRENRKAQTGDQRYYQIILNSLGKKLDVVYDPAKGVPDNGWNLSGHTFANHIDRKKNRWELELAIPWKSIGADGPRLVGKEIGLLAARHWQRPTCQSRFALARLHAFSQWQDYPGFVLKPDAPVIREESLGAVFDALFDYKLNIRDRAGKDLRLKVEASVASNDMPTKTFNQELTVPADRSAMFDVKTLSGSFHKEAANTLQVKVLSADDEAVLYQHQLTIKKPREWVWQIGGSAEENTSFYIAHYPSLGKLAVKLDLAAAEGAESIHNALVQVVDSQKKVLLSEKLPVHNKVGEALLSLPSLADGMYTVRVTLESDQGSSKPLEKTFLRVKFPWEGNTLGMTDEIFAPFTPIQAKDDEVETVLRKHKLNGFGLWDSVTSMGKELLAGPMTVEFETADGKGTWTTKNGKLTQTRPNLAVYEATAESPAVVLNTTSSMEEDGCMKVEMEIVPGKTPAVINRLSVNIPIKDELAPFWHAIISGECRSNPVGAAPQGQGVIWDSSKTGNGTMLGAFLPYIWLGGTERGVLWFANNDKDWSLNDDQPAQVLTRQNGRLILTLNLIARPTKLDVPRKIVFGLQATPAKPMLADWRKKMESLSGVHGGANIYWGILQHYSGKYPAERDFRIIDEMLKGRVSGRVSDAGKLYFENWMKEKVTVTDPDIIKQVRTSVWSGFHWVVRTGKKPQFIYYEGHTQDQTSEEWKVFQDEWGKEQYTPRKWTEKLEKANDLDADIFVHTNRSYADFSLWYAREWMKRGFGLYSDNCFPISSFNTLVSDAYLRKDGQTQPSAGIWEMRDYYKRMWKLKNQLQADTPYPLLQCLHVTNGLLVPVISWNDVDLDIEWEWKAGKEHFPADVILTETTGRQAGNIGVVHHMLIPRVDWYAAVAAEKTAPEKREELIRSEWGIRFIHELLRDTMHLWRMGDMRTEKLVRDFGYGNPDCAVINYWSTDEISAAQPAIACKNPGVKWIGLWKAKENELLLVLINWGREAQQAEVTVKAPDKGELATWKDAESGAAINPAALSFQPFEVKIIKGSK